LGYGDFAVLLAVMVELLIVCFREHFETRIPLNDMEIFIVHIDFCIAFLPSPQFLRFGFVGVGVVNLWEIAV
jgi:hypothetical protein